MFSQSNERKYRFETQFAFIFLFEIKLFVIEEYFEITAELTCMWTLITGK